MSVKAAKLNTLADLTPAAYNPREIGAAQFAGLGRSLESFGDLSGIVWNAQTGRLVAGHQRVKALAEAHGADLAISHAKNGIDRSWIVAGGETFPIRIVDWNETTEKAANIAANSAEIAGTFTDGLGPILDELRVSFDGFDDLRFEELLPPEPIDYAAAWEGMPECESEDQTAFHSIRVNFTCGEDIQEFGERLGMKFTDRTRSFWFPEKEPRDRGEVYAEESGGGAVELSVEAMIEGL